MIKIIIVDDHEIFRNGLTAILNQNSDMEVVETFKNGKEFIDQIEQTDSEIILMDINMPVMDGVEATKLALAKKPGLKIIILSMYDDTQYYNALIDQGVCGFILKDSNYNELIKAIQRVKDNDTYFSQKLLIKILRNKDQKQNVHLTEREQDLLNLLARGYTTQDISDELKISFRTVERHRSNLFLKTDTNNSLKLLVFAIKNDLVKI